MPKIFVTGASGYLGSTFLSYIREDWNITALDVVSPNGALPRQVSFVKGSINDEPLIAKLLKDADIVLHLAAVKGSENCRLNSREAVEVNICGTHNLLRQTVLNKIKKFIFASTYWVYGESTRLPFKEEMPVRPDELYGLSKAVSEIELSLSKIDYVILRFTNIFGLGSGNAPEEVVFNFIKSAFESKPIKLVAGGTQELDFIDIDDACKCLLEVIANKNVSRSVLNVGSGRPTSIAELAQIICKVFKRKYKINVIIKNIDSGNKNVTNRWVSVEKLKSKIGEIAFRPLELSIEAYVEKYKERMNDKGSKAVL